MRHNIEKLPLRIRRKKLEELRLDTSLDEIPEPASGFYDLNYSQVWPDIHIGVIKTNSTDSSRVHRREANINSQLKSMMESLDERKDRIRERSKDLPEVTDPAEKSESEESSSSTRNRGKKDAGSSKISKGTFFRGNRKIPFTLGIDSPGPASYLYQNYTVKGSISEGKGGLMLGRIPTPRTKRRLEKLNNEDGLSSVEDSEDDVVPGPGAYNVEKSLLKSNGIMIGKTVKRSMFDE